jgi:hypothetical protein
VSTNGRGVASFGFTISTKVPLGRRITATATDKQNDTSEFSSCKRVAA